MTGSPEPPGPGGGDEGSPPAAGPTETGETPADIDPDRVQLELLQGFRISRGGRAVDVPLGAQRLIAFLALRDRPVQRAFVAGNLWLDKPEKVACASLRSAPWQLRRSGPDIVTVTRGQLRLPPSLPVDVRDTITQAQRVIQGSRDLRGHPAAADR